MCKFSLRTYLEQLTAGFLIKTRIQQHTAHTTIHLRKPAPVPIFMKLTVSQRYCVENPHTDYYHNGSRNKGSMRRNSLTPLRIVRLSLCQFVQT
jgi:hypothetical protein